MQTTSLRKILRGRKADLRTAFQHQKVAGASTMKQALQRAIDSPTSRFWIRAEHAMNIVVHMQRHRSLRHLSPEKREMYQEIFTRYRRMKHECPAEPLLALCQRLVLQPAPKFYISLRTAMREVLK